MTRTKSQFYFGIILVCLAALIVLGYAFYEAWDYFSGPAIAVSSPKNGATITEPLVEIQGTAINGNEIFLNGQRILTNDKGEFKERLLLADGYNIIGLKVEDKFKRIAEQRLELVYKK